MNAITPAPAKRTVDRKTRRACLQVLGLTGISLQANWLFAAAQNREKKAANRAVAHPGWKAAVVEYLESLAKADGGYGWEDQDQSHLTVVWAVLGSYQMLGEQAPRRPALVQLIPTLHPHRGRKPERALQEFDRQQIESLRWLDADTSAFKSKVSAWGGPLPYPTRYERNGNPVVEQEVAALLCRELLGLSTDTVAKDYLDYLAARRRPSGVFNYTLARDGSDGHVLPTWWALRALRLLKALPEPKNEMIAWLRACQRDNGGFAYAPKPPLAGGDDVAFTEAAVQALAILGAEPADKKACIDYLWSLQAQDGGFADRPGWHSNPLATYRALSALAALGALEAGPTVLPNRVKPRTAGPKSQPIPADHRVWTIQLEAHGRGSCYEAVDMAGTLRIHLWGAKNAQGDWIKRAQAIADERKTPSQFCVADEEYGTYVTIPGLGTYSHTSDIFAPAGADIGAPVGRQTPVTWEEYRRERLVPLEKAGGRVFWQFGENESFTRAMLDDSLDRGGFAAISTFHFGNPDFTISQPFLYRYRHRLPFVALQDAHGDESWWWGDMLSGFRTIFIGPAPTWENWLEALKRDWVMAIRRDAVTNYSLRMHGGAAGVRDFVLSRAADWQWWGKTPDEVRRPWVSLVPLRAEDKLETGHPERGIALRIRCAWTNTTQGLPKKQLAELARVELDGVEVAAGEELAKKLVRRRNQRGALADVYHLIALPDLKAGEHRAKAHVKLLETGKMAHREVAFQV